MGKRDHDVTFSGAALGPAYRSSRRLLGEQLRQARRAACWTQQELATEVGIHPCKLSRYERGSDWIPPRLLLELVEALELPLGYGRASMRNH